MRDVNTIFRNGNMLITITHESSDPAYWIVRQWSLSWWSKKRLNSLWFTSREQAIRCAESFRAAYVASLADRE